MPRKTSRSKDANRPAATTAHQPTAPETYAAHAGDIDRLIDALTMELDAHADRAAGEPQNRALVGDLAKIRADLLNLVAFICDKQPADIETFLAE